MTLVLVQRPEWRARPALSRVTASMQAKTTGHWEGPTMKVGGSLTWDHSNCPALVRGIQNFHMDVRKWKDIAYNFLICPHGVVFVGRGLNIVNGANGTTMGNKTSHAVCWVAGVDNPFSDESELAFRELVTYIHNGTGAPSNEAQGHRDHKATDCPGQARYVWIHAGMPVNLGGGTPPPPVVPLEYGKSLLTVGMMGEAVRRVQEIIFVKAGGNLVIDGNFGPVTEARVRGVQTGYGISVDGVVGTKTYEVLDRMWAATDTQFGWWPFTDKPVVRLNDNSMFVRYLQELLTARAGLPLGFDGRFGPKTLSAVKIFQTAHGLSSDGVVGPITWREVDKVALPR